MDDDSTKAEEMSESNDKREALWDQFLKRWPLEDLGKMTLAEYTQAGNKDAFVNWLESRTESLGSIWGGSSFKFGVYSRKDKSKRSDGSGLRYSESHAWLARYGDTAEEAFAAVRKRIQEVAEAARAGKLDVVEAADLGTVIKWNIAFLYQDRAAPCIAPIFKAESLQVVAGPGMKSCADMHAAVMARRGQQDVLTYGDALWAEIQAKQPTKTAPSEREAAAPSQPGTSSVPPRQIPLNQILYGPPGTGKTYATIDEALAVLDAQFLADYPERPSASREEKVERRSTLKSRFDARVGTGHIRFVTFHQSFSYEDFVEGIRAKPDGDQGLTYAVEAGVFKSLCEQTAQDDQARVLIIDEINRGNVSRIFGELITLIETSKRAGSDEVLSVTLPYSKDRFSVPGKLYLIGTMNTADRSLAGMDIALRRRFTFKEMPPMPELLSGVDVEGVNVGAMLTAMNERIEVLLDRDHALGHAFFMRMTEDGGNTLAALKTIFQRQVLPLLEEYFFEDWERIGWVLNDPAKGHDDDKFIVKSASSGTDMAALFPGHIAERLHDRRWRLNTKALDRISAYQGILAPPKA